MNNINSSNNKIYAKTISGKIIRVSLIILITFLIGMGLIVLYIWQGYFNG